MGEKIPGVLQHRGAPGLGDVGDEMKPRLTYFNFRGRAEAIRLILEEAGIDYEERLVDPAEWNELKPRMPFGQIPLYEEGDLTIPQSHAICRHLARLHGLYGRTENERTQCDVAIDAIRDAQLLLWSILTRDRWQDRRAEIERAEIVPSLAALQRWFLRNGSSAEYWAGESLTFADLVAFVYLDQVRAFFPGALASTPRLSDFRLGVAARPRIAAYLNSPRRSRGIGYVPNRGVIMDPVFEE